jgi:hypothetical protein
LSPVQPQFVKKLKQLTNIIFVKDENKKLLPDLKIPLALKPATRMNC